MKTFFVSLNCGCCNDEVSFKDDQAIQKAFHELGLTSSGTLRDDEGKIVEGVDTFYGFSCKQEDQDDKSLQYLAKRLSDML